MALTPKQRAQLLQGVGLFSGARAADCAAIAERARMASVVAD